MNQYLIGLVVFLLALFGAEQCGEHTVQVEWNKDKAIRKALLDQEKQHNQETVDELEAQHQKDLKAATNAAGRRAIDRWLHDHGLLPDGSAMPSAGAVPPQGAQVPDGAAGQQGVGDGLARFAAGCASDALMVLDWQELCVRQHCEVE